MKEKFKDLWAILKNTGGAFGDNSVPKLSAALSYYTLFSLSPMLVVMMGIGNLFFAEEIIQGHLYEFIYNTLGKDSAVTIQETLKNQRLEGDAEEWNTYHIKIDYKSNRGEVTLNDVLINSFPLKGAEWEAMVAKSKFSKSEESPYLGDARWYDFGKFQKGSICFQDHPGKVWFKNIRIKELD